MPDELTKNVALCGPDVRQFDQAMWHYPDDPNCDHDVVNQKCRCISKCARWIKDQITDPLPLDMYEVKKTYHKEVLALAQKHMFSIVEEPLLKHIPLARRFFGIWHSPHNCRQSMWVHTRDVAATFKVIPALERAMVELKLENIKVGAVKRPKRETCVDDIMTAEAEAHREAVVNAEDKGTKRTSMDGKELKTVIDAYSTVVVESMREAVEPRHQSEFQRWCDLVEPAITHFNAGCAIIAAPLWESNRAHEAGVHFRAWADLIHKTGRHQGLQHPGSAYLNILPAHFLTEPSHMEKMASDIYEQYGVAPASGSDAITEKENQVEKRRLSTGRGSSTNGRISTTRISGCKFTPYLLKKYATQLLEPDAVPSYLNKFTSLVTKGHNKWMGRQRCSACKAKYGKDSPKVIGHSKHMLSCPVNQLKRAITKRRRGVVKTEQHSLCTNKD